MLYNWLGAGGSLSFLPKDPTLFSILSLSMDAVGGLEPLLRFNFQVGTTLLDELLWLRLAIAIDLIEAVKLPMEMSRWVDSII